LHNSEATRNQFRDFLILVLEQTERICYIVPLSLSLAPRQSGGEFVGKLLGVFILLHVLAIEL
jgi:hypothetical protein